MNPLTEFLIADESSILQLKMMEANHISILKSIRPSILKTLPEIAINKIIYDGGKVANSGDIIIRSMSTTALNESIKHYGIVYGTAFNGEELIIDMAPNTNVRCRTIKEFMCDFIDIEIIPKPKETDLKEILNRVQEWEFKNYCFYDKNCQQFATYCVFGRKYSPAIEFLNKTLLPIVEYKLSQWLDRKRFPDNINHMDLIEQQIQRYTKLKNSLT